jgi:hypothetical protein
MDLFDQPNSDNRVIQNSYRVAQQSTNLNNCDLPQYADVSKQPISAHVDEERRNSELSLVGSN